MPVVFVLDIFCVFLEIETVVSLCQLAFVAKQSGADFLYLFSFICFQTNKKGG